MGLKKCSKCGRDDVEFYRNKNHADGFESQCKICHSQHDKGRYDKDPQKFKDAQARRRKEKRAFIIRAKERPCADCGHSFPWYCMDFDHLSDKKFNVSEVAKRNIGWKRLKEEIAKCDVVCANCHRKRTFGRGERLPGER